MRAGAERLRLVHFVKVMVQLNRHKLSKHHRHDLVSKINSDLLVQIPIQLNRSVIRPTPSFTPPPALFRKAFCRLPKIHKCNWSSERGINITKDGKKKIMYTHGAPGKQTEDSAQYV